jgi:LPXTG-motif cell wall-anchored protein
MFTTTSTTPTLRRLAAAGAFAAVLSLGVGTAAAQDQHSGGVSPNSETADPGDPKVEVSAGSVGRGGLPITGSDVAGLTAVGLVAVAAGSGALVVSKRRARLSA